MSRSRPRPESPSPSGSLLSSVVVIVEVVDVVVGVPQAFVVLMHHGSVHASERQSFRHARPLETIRVDESQVAYLA
jgi:hypothetical protein